MGDRASDRWAPAGAAFGSRTLRARVRIMIVIMKWLLLIMIVIIVMMIIIIIKMLIMIIIIIIVMIMIMIMPRRAGRAPRFAFAPSNLDIFPQVPPQFRKVCWQLGDDGFCASLRISFGDSSTCHCLAEILKPVSHPRNTASPQHQDATGRFGPPEAGPAFPDCCVENWVQPNKQLEKIIRHAFRAAEVEMKDALH